MAQNSRVGVRIMHRYLNFQDVNVFTQKSKGTSNDIIDLLISIINVPVKQQSSDDVIGSFTEWSNRSVLQMLLPPCNNTIILFCNVISDILY